MAKANELFQRYTDQMVHHLPGVVFPEGTTAADLRRTKPILFNAILAGAASESPNLQRSLVRELMQTPRRQAERLTAFLDDRTR